MLFYIGENYQSLLFEQSKIVEKLLKTSIKKLKEMFSQRRINK